MSYDHLTLLINVEELYVHLQVMPYETQPVTIMSWANDFLPRATWSNKSRYLNKKMSILK